MISLGIDNGLPDYKDSVIENDPVNMSTVSEDSCKFELFEELTQVRKSHPRKLITHFLTDVHGICFSSVKVAEGNVNAAYEAFEAQISNVIDRHTPVQHAYQRKKKFPGMNSVLKKLFV